MEGTSTRPNRPSTCFHLYSYPTRAHRPPPALIPRWGSLFFHLCSCCIGFTVFHWCSHCVTGLRPAAGDVCPPCIYKQRSGLLTLTEQPTAPTSMGGRMAMERQRRSSFPITRSVPNHQILLISITCALCQPLHGYSKHHI